MLAKILLVLPFLLTPPALAAGRELQDGFFKTSDNVKLHDLEAGTGPPIFFEPGWSMPAWIGDPQIQYFAEHYHVVALDPRSPGDSDKPLDGNSPERRAQDIKELDDAGQALFVDDAARFDALLEDFVQHLAER